MTAYNLDVILRAKQEGMGVLKEAENGLANMAKAGALAAVALGATLATGAIEAYKRTEELGQAAYEMGEKFGLAGGQASAWISVAQQLGIGSEQIGKGFQFLSKNATTLQLTLDAGGKIAGTTAQVYKDLGINVLDAGGRVKSANGLMLEVADAFKAMGDGPEKAALALRLFGRSGTDLIPILNEGRSGIEAMMAQGQKLGTVMSTSQVTAIHAAYLAHKQFDAALQGLSNRIGIAVLPVMARFFDYMVSTAIPAVQRLANWLKSLGPDLQKGYDIFKAWAPFIIGVAAAWALWNVGLAITAGLQAVIAGGQFVLGLMQIVRTVGLATAAQWLFNIALTANPIGLVIIAIAALVAGVIWAYQNVGWFRFAVDALWGALKAFASQFWTDVKPVLDFLGPIFHTIADAVGAFKDQFWADIKPIFDWLGPVLQDAISWLGQLAQALGLAANNAPAAANYSAAAHARTFAGPRGPVGTAHAIGAAGGFEGTVYRPTLFLAGEGGSPEHVSIGSGGRSTTVHIHFEGGFYSDGPALDRLTMAIANRLSFVTGR